MKKIVLISPLLFLFLILFSCRRAGTGGDNTLVVFPKHHATSVSGATVFVRFNAKDFPGSTKADYDIQVDGEANEDHVHVKGLRKGNYFLYCTAFDSTISSLVSGGIAVTISSKSGEKDIDLPVTE